MASRLAWSRAARKNRWVLAARNSRVFVATATAKAKQIGSKKGGECGEETDIGCD